MTKSIDRRQFATLAAAATFSPMAFARNEWRLATGYKADTFHTVNMQQLAREVDAATNGDLLIAVHPNNSLAKLSEIRVATESGRIEAGEVIMGGLVGVVPIAGADSVPFIVDSYASAQRMWRAQKPLIEKHFESRGLQSLYAVAWPSQGLFSTKPIESVADLRGTRMRTFNATTVRIANLVGAQPVDVPMVDVAKALADGRIETMITSSVTGVEAQVWSHLRYFYDIRAFYPKNIVFANSKAMAKLSAPTKLALLNASRAAESRGWAASEALSTSSLDVLRSHNMKIERPSNSLSVELKRFGEKFSLEWLREVGAEANQIFIPYFAGS